MRFSKKKLVSVVAAAVMLLGMTSMASAETITFFQGFESNTSGWFDYGSTINRVASGTNGISSASGSYHAEVTNGAGGVFTRFEGYQDTWVDDYYASIDIYLDPDWAVGSGFDYSVASNTASGGHLQDFIFHVEKDADTETLLVGGSNNSNWQQTPSTQGNLEDRNHYEVTSAGWYTFQTSFKNIGGVLEVDLNLLNSNGDTLWTETRVDPGNLIPTVVGGHRYGWFTYVNLSDDDGAVSLAIDNTEMTGTPEPGTMLLFGSAAGLIGFIRRRRNRKKEI